MKYRKKPVVIEAEQFAARPHEWDAIVAFLLQPGVYGQWAWADNGDAIIIHTLEGDMQAGPGDWIIRGVKGELYPCKDDIFRATYEPVEEARS